MTAENGMSTPAKHSDFRFAVLHHTDWPGNADHFDLFLEFEMGEDLNQRALKAFATISDEFPDARSHADFKARGEQAGNPLAKANLFTLRPNHRRLYLDFEGPVTLGRGSVVSVDSGKLSWDQMLDADLREARFYLEGQQLKGGFRLRHMGAGTFSFERLKRV